LAILSAGHDNAPSQTQTVHDRSYIVLNCIDDGAGQFIRTSATYPGRTNATSLGVTDRHASASVRMLTVGIRSRGLNGPNCALYSDAIMNRNKQTQEMSHGGFK
jgi:hypothetical protein